MNTVDMTKYLKEAVKIEGFDLTSMPLADLTDRDAWKSVNPELVQILRWPRKSELGGIELTDAAKQTRSGGWVLAVGDAVDEVCVGDQVTFQPLNFSRDEVLTEALVKGNEQTRDTEIGYVREKDLDQYHRTEEPTEGEATA